MGSCLVTGGAGFIGSHVAEHLANSGVHVIVLDDLSGGYRENVPPHTEFIEGSILDDTLIEKIFRDHKIDYVYHLAAYAAEGLSHFIRRFNYRNNLIGTINLINAAVKHECKCFVFTSSIAVYGTNQLPMSEELDPKPEDPYGIAKYAIELDLAAAREMFGLNYVILRPHNVFGERQNLSDPYRNVLGIFMRQILSGQPMTIFGDGAQTRAFSYIDDVAPVIAGCTKNENMLNDVFNVGSSDPTSVKDLAHIIAEALGLKADINYLPARNEVQHAYPSHAKLEERLSYRPEWSLEQGVEKMADWVKEQTIHPCKVFTDIEIMRNLPQSWATLIKEQSQGD